MTQPILRTAARPLLLVFALLAGLQGCSSGTAEHRRSWSWEDDARPSWLPPPQDRYPGQRLPDDGFRDHLARLAPDHAARAAATPS